MALNVDNFRRVKLAHLPTPLEFASRLTAQLGGPQVWIKRDDCTGLAFGGNKARKLEFFLGEALDQHADTIITMGPIQSNHVRMTAAASRKVGMECHAVLVGNHEGDPTGNFFLDHLFDLKYTLINQPLDDLPPGLIEEEMEKSRARLISEGRRPYLVPPGGAGPLGEISYALALDELLSQAREMDLEIDYVVTPVGSQGTFSGLILGKKLIQSSTDIIGISVNLEGTAELAGLPSIDQMIVEAAKLLDVRMGVSPDEYELHYDYVGEGYGIPTQAGMEAIKIMARLEGILLDTTYTGKSLAGLIDLISKNRFSRTDVVVYLHTGGGPGLFINNKAFHFDKARD